MGLVKGAIAATYAAGLEYHSTTDADGLMVGLKVRDSETLNVLQRRTTFSRFKPSAALLFTVITVHVFGQRPWHGDARFFDNDD